MSVFDHGALFRRAAVMIMAAGTIGTLVSVAPQAEAAPQQLRVVTANLDFNLKPAQAKTAADWKQVIAPNADIAFLQEAKNVKLKNFIDSRTWIVLQNTTSSDRAGSAVVIRRSVIKGKPSESALVKGTPGGSCPKQGIETRWINKTQVRLANGRLIRIASLHMPPQRCQTGPGSRYDVMSNNVVGFVNRTNMPTVLGADWNKTVDADPNQIGRRTGLKPYGPNSAKGDATRIDGFYASKQFSVTQLKHLRDDNSDHTPVQMKISIAAP